MTDAEVLGALAAATEADRAGVRAAVAAVGEADGALVEWRGGRPGADGVVQVTYPVYAPAVHQLLGALAGAGAVPVFAWPSWDGVRRLRSVDDLAAAPLADVARFLTTVVRGERFSEGTVAAALEDGRLLTAARRVADGR
ncbi:DUF6508 domain-containing protein [Geodermatophilus sp. SYSU D01045]